LFLWKWFFHTAHLFVPYLNRTLEFILGTSIMSIFNFSKARVKSFILLVNLQSLLRKHYVVSCGLSGFPWKMTEFVIKFCYDLNLIAFCYFGLNIVLLPQNILNCTEGLLLLNVTIRSISEKSQLPLSQKVAWTRHHNHDRSTPSHHRKYF
jgi:hypothetical protein